MKNLHILLNIVMVLTIGCLLAKGYRSPETELRESEHLWEGVYVEDLIEDLCCENNIDYGDNWVLSCPECSGVHYIYFKNKGALITRFLFVSKDIIDEIKPGESAEISMGPGKTLVYCDICKYPLGYEWQLLGYGGEVKE